MWSLILQEGAQQVNKGIKVEQSHSATYIISCYFHAEKPLEVNILAC